LAYPQQFDPRHLLHLPDLAPGKGLGAGIGECRGMVLFAGHGIGARPPERVRGFLSTFFMMPPPFIRFRHAGRAFGRAAPWLIRSWLTAARHAFHRPIFAIFSALWADFRVWKIPLNMLTIRVLTMYGLCTVSYYDKESIP